MNRIYQGKVTKVERLDAKGQPVEQLSLDVLWQHHALFQDAVNYYLVCLMALATGGCEETRRIVELRERMTTKRPDHPEDDHFYVWGPFRRRGTTRQGMRDSVGPYLCPGKAEATPEECFAAVFAGNPCAQIDEGRKCLDRGLHQLLSKCTGASGCRNAAPEFLPRFCDPGFGGNYAEDAGSLTRNAEKSLFPFILHDPGVSAQSPELDAFGVLSIALPNAKKPEMGGADATARLREMLAAWREREPDKTNDWARIEAQIAKLPADIVLPGYAPTSAKGEVKFRLFAMFLFRYVERSEFTFGLLRATTPAPKPDAKRPEPLASSGSGDPIRLARGERGYVFRAFTSLPGWSGNDSGEPQWLRFDVAAFEEALKALHQVDDKGEDRQKELALKQVRHDYQRGRTKKWRAEAGSEEEHRPPVLAGDPRIERLEQLLNSDLADEYEMSEGMPVKYGLQPRTVRGFRDLRKKWNDMLKAGEGYSGAAREKLLAALRDYQIENPQLVGSVRLFAALLDEPNWIIWREPDVEQLRAWRKATKLADDIEFAKDPVQALTDERELLSDIERLKQPVRLTPADPEHSRRQFYFSDAEKFTERGAYRHEPNQRTVIVPLAMREGNAWKKARARLHYSAPRLLREGLRADEGENLEAMPWLQPMMAALGLHEPMPQDFHDCPVALMPDVTASGDRRILLNFPLTLDEQPLARQLGKQKWWEGERFGGGQGEYYWLRWPSTQAPKAKSPTWWESVDSFRCLAVDLGQRDAGAFALLEAIAGSPPKPQSRKLGEAGGKIWWATVRATGLLRLPGEDAMVLRDGQWQEELSGERGRLASGEEWQEAHDICAKLGLDPVTILGDDPRRYSFPELNDRLLFALRRAQTRLARLQSWSCIAADGKRRQRIAEDITSSAAAVEQDEEGEPLSAWDELVTELASLVEKEAWQAVAGKLISELEKKRAIIPRELVRIADRIQPLRERRWEWALRDDGSRCHVLRQTMRGTDPRPKLLAGQRGLSMERLEQLENLRQRCQSLNRALLQAPGQPAKLGRSKRGIELPDPCPELLDQLKKLKEQRVNQTAHLILAQALGVRLRPHANSSAMRAHRDIHGEYEKFREPVDFLVLESLDRYLASQGRSRAENTRLMKWCHRQVLGKLKQLCEPYGLRVLETPAAYSSRFCSLTSVAGFRAVELTPDNRETFRWRKHLDRLADPERAKKLDKEERQESERVKALFDSLDRLNEGLLKNRPARPKWRTLLAPVAGGPIFVPMKGSCQQADINAAINLGLRAIAAPENHEIHVRIRSERKNDKFFVRAENLREKARWKSGVPEILIADEKSRTALLTEARPNFFADLANVANFDRVEIAGLSCAVASGRGLWGTINRCDWQRVEEINRARIQKWERATDDIPM